MRVEETAVRRRRNTLASPLHDVVDGRAIARVRPEWMPEAQPQRAETLKRFGRELQRIGKDLSASIKLKCFS